MSSTVILHMGSSIKSIAEQGLRLLVKSLTQVAVSKDPSQQERVSNAAEKVRTLVLNARCFFEGKPEFKSNSKVLEQLRRDAHTLVHDASLPPAIQNCAHSAWGILTLAKRARQDEQPQDPAIAPLDEEDICHIAGHANAILEQVSMESINDAWEDLTAIASVEPEEGHQKVLNALYRDLERVQPQTADTRDSLGVLDRLYLKEYPRQTVTVSLSPERLKKRKSPS